MIAFDAVPGDVRPMGRKFNDVWNQAIWDNVVQEVDIATGDLLFEWRASEHVNLTRTYRKLDPGDGGTVQNPFDFFHANSVDQDDGGSYLVSARNTHAIYYIDGKTKEVIWTLGGKGNDFMDLSDGHALNFAWQHDARFVSSDAFPETYHPPASKEGVTKQLLSLFDNAALDWDYSYGPPYSRGLILELTYPTPGVTHRSDPTPEDGDNSTPSPSPSSPTSPESDPLSAIDAAKLAAINGTNPAYTVRLIHRYHHPDHLQSSTQGSLQLLSQQQDPDTPRRDPHVLLGYGINALATTFSPSNPTTPLCDLHFAASTSWEKGDAQSYRAYKAAWVGRPRSRPSLTIRTINGEDVAFASWNGATDVHSWELDLIDTYDRADGEEQWTLRDTLVGLKFNFEEPFRLTERYAKKRYLRVRAVGGRIGSPLENGVSEVLDRGYFRTKVGLRLGVGVGVSTLGLLVVAVGSAVAVVLLLRVYRRVVGRRWRRWR